MSSNGEGRTEQGVKDGYVEFRAEAWRIERWRKAFKSARKRDPALTFSAWRRIALDEAAARELGA